MSNDLGPQKLLIQKKQTKQMEPMSNSLGPQQSSILSSRLTMMVPTVGPQNLAVPNRRPTQVISMPNFTSPQSNKRNSPMDPSPKGQSESSESVRSKLRESLAASLALVHKQYNKVGGSDSPSIAAGISKADNEDAHLAKSISTSISSYNITENPNEYLSFGGGCAPNIISLQASTQEVSVDGKTEGTSQRMKSDGQESQPSNVFLDEDPSSKDNFLVKDEFLQGNGLCWESDLHLDASKEMENPAKRSKVVPELGEDGDGNPLQSPQSLATSIEAELFKLFGGVNKKYKEKGRSLLFNLKDRSNPELRERVMSGEIPPHRLCSMTAEELASKELSMWRIAKAEELAHMVVLQDSETDVRRLVKKTHKGEFEVEFEQDDGVSVEVAVGSSLLPQYQPKPDGKNAEVSSKPNDSGPSVSTTNEVNSQDQSLQSSLFTIPIDDTDLMQDVVDELKDGEFLPPIVSLDEFMESIDLEPPFENLPVDAGKVMLKSDENLSSEDDVKLRSSDICSVNLVDTAPNKPDATDMTYPSSDGSLKSNHIEKELDTFSPGSAPKHDYVWEGLVQLNVSAMVTVSGYFKSGEKTSVKEWPNFLDVKGRVRLDAFEKFLQELPMSRTRAIMIVHFCWKEGSSESGRMHLCEVVESYIVDERVGFSEPVPGVELYLCPPHGKPLEILGKNLSKDHTEILNAVNDGLIGVVVWRKPHLSPNSSSHHKHSSKKQHSHLRRQHEKNTNIRPPAAAENSEPIDDVPPGFGPASTVDDDLPEFEFGGGSNSCVLKAPGTTTPSQSHDQPPPPPPPPPPRPVEKIRELIHKYGQSEMGGSNRGNWHGQGSHSWNDDDDIPEWQPQLQPQTTQNPQPPQLHPQQQMPPPPLPPLPSHNTNALQLMHNHLQQLNVPPHLVNQQQLMSMPMQPQQQQPPPPPPQQVVQYSQPMGQLVSLHPMAIQSPLQPTTSMMMMMQQNMASPWQQGTRWTLPPGHYVQGNGQPFQVQFPGQNVMDWRPDLPGSSRQF